MIPKPTLFLLAAALVCSPTLAQTPGDKPLTENDLLKQIESLTPSGVKANAAPRGTPSPESKPISDASTPAAGKKSTGQKEEKAGEKKGKGPTEITALEAVFDQKAHLAIFIGSVVVKDPEFNVTCDKLTAHLKSDDKAGASPAAPAGKPTPKPATPKPAEAGAAPKKSGGLEKALAESTSEKRVVITQDKTEADGSITHSIGISDKASYDAVTGDIVLTGMPDVTQGINRCIATDPRTIMTLNRDGHMRADGPHKTIIVDKGDVVDSK